MSWSQAAEGEDGPPPGVGGPEVVARVERLQRSARGRGGRLWLDSPPASTSSTLPPASACPPEPRRRPRRHARDPRRPRGGGLCWAVSVLCSSRSSRLIEPMAVVAWMMLVGLVITAPLAAVTGLPAHLHGAALVWLILSGAGNVGGLIVNYYALRIGQVSLVAPIVSTEGAIAAIIAVLAGQSLAAAVGVTLLVIVIGVGWPRSRRVIARIWMPPAIRGRSSWRSPRGGLRREPLRHRPRRRRAARVVGGAVRPAHRRDRPGTPAGAGRPAATDLPSGAVRGRIRAGRGRRLLLLHVGSRHGLAIAAVLSSQFAVLALAASFVLFDERLSRIQLAGVAVRDPRGGGPERAARLRR